MKDVGVAHNTRRGFVPRDAAEFGARAVEILKEAQRDVLFLLDRGYAKESAVTFAGDHFRLSARQRAALLRATCSSQAADSRISRRKDVFSGETVYLDGFNIIISLEAAQSPETTLLKCMEGCIRDLCGLHGTYRLIADTQTAVRWIAQFLKANRAGRSVFYLDAPVSNSGNLKKLIGEIMEEEQFPADILLSRRPDAELSGRANVASGDALVLDRCHSWINLAAHIIARELPGRRLVELDAGTPC
jgi:hypothetical protein